MGSRLMRLLHVEKAETGFSARRSRLVTVRSESDWNKSVMRIDKKIVRCEFHEMRLSALIPGVRLSPGKTAGPRKRPWPLTVQ